MTTFDQHVEDALDIVRLGREVNEMADRKPSVDPDPTRPIRRERPTPPPPPKEKPSILPWRKKS